MHFFLLFVVVEAKHKMAPNARCANNGQTDDSLITYSAQGGYLWTEHFGRGVKNLLMAVQK